MLSIVSQSLHKKGNHQGNCRASFTHLSFFSFFLLNERGKGEISKFTLIASLV